MMLENTLSKRLVAILFLMFALTRCSDQVDLENQIKEVKDQNESVRLKLQQDIATLEGYRLKLSDKESEPAVQSDVSLWEKVGGKRVIVTDKILKLEQRLENWIDSEELGDNYKISQYYNDELGSVRDDQELMELIGEKRENFDKDNVLIGTVDGNPENLQPSSDGYFVPYDSVTARERLSSSSGEENKNTENSNNQANTGIESDNPSDDSQNRINRLENFAAVNTQQDADNEEQKAVVSNNDENNATGEQNDSDISTGATENGDFVSAEINKTIEMQKIAELNVDVEAVSDSTGESNQSDNAESSVENSGDNNFSSGDFQSPGNHSVERENVAQIILKTSSEESSEEESANSSQSQSEVEGELDISESNELETSNRLDRFEQITSADLEDDETHNLSENEQQSSTSESQDDSEPQADNEDGEETESDAKEEDETKSEHELFVSHNRLHTYSNNQKVTTHRKHLNRIHSSSRLRHHDIFSGDLSNSRFSHNQVLYYPFDKNYSNRHFLERPQQSKSHLRNKIHFTGPISPKSINDANMHRIIQREKRALATISKELREERKIRRMMRSLEDQGINPFAVAKIIFDN